MARTPRNDTLAARLELRHDELRAEMRGVDRLAVALYDGETDSLRTFSHSTEGATLLSHHQTRRAGAPWQAELARNGAARVLPVLSALSRSPRPHTRAVLARGYR